VLVRTGVTPKDLWIHTCVWNISCGEIKESSRLTGRLRMILRLGGRSKPTEVRGAASCGIRAYNFFFYREDTEGKL
jgi:hypothetical protein